MKKVLAVVAASLLLVLAGCSGSTQMSNPVTGYSDPFSFERITGVFIDAPEGGENKYYSIISEEIAQVQFELDGHEYTYRAAVTEDDISGVYYEFEDTLISVGATAITVSAVTGGESGTLAAWNDGDARFTLWCGDDIDAQTYAAFAAGLPRQR